MRMRIFPIYPDEIRGRQIALLPSQSRTRTIHIKDQPPENTRPVLLDVGLFDRRAPWSDLKATAQIIGTVGPSGKIVEELLDGATHREHRLFGRPR